MIALGYDELILFLVIRNLWLALSGQRGAVVAVMVPLLLRIVLQLQPG